MLLFLVMCLLLCPVWAAADVSCDGIDDDLSTAISASNFLGATASIVLVYTPTGTPDSGYSECYGGEFLVSDAAGGPYFGFYRHPDFDGGDRLCAYNWSGEAAQIISVPYSVDVRTHLAWVLSAGSLFFYKDGALVNSVASGDTEALNRTFRICGGTAALSDNSVPGEGRIIEAKTYDVALTAAQIQAEGTSAVHNVIPVTATARWDFDDCSVGASANGVVFSDRSGNGRPITGDFGTNSTGMSCLGSSIPYAWGVW